MHWLTAHHTELSWGIKCLSEACGGHAVHLSQDIDASSLHNGNGGLLTSASVLYCSGLWNLIKYSNTLLLNSPTFSLLFLSSTSPSLPTLWAWIFVFPFPFIYSNPISHLTYSSMKNIYACVYEIYNVLSILLHTRKLRLLACDFVRKPLSIWGSCTRRWECIWHFTLYVLMRALSFQIHMDIDFLSMLLSSLT